MATPDALRGADISLERVRALGGWAGGGNAEKNYRQGLRPSTLFNEITTVRYPGLDLTHLVPGQIGADNLLI